MITQKWAWDKDDYFPCKGAQGNLPCFFPLCTFVTLCGLKTKARRFTDEPLLIEMDRIILDQTFRAQRSNFRTWEYFAKTR
jgi:hypothetical protein